MASHGIKLPVVWEIEVPSKNLKTVVRALNPDAWVDHSVTYWEGPVRASGSHTGSGYLEMTGYE